MYAYMNDDKKIQFNERMKVLNDKYCKQLPTKYQEIESSWNTYLANISGSETLDEFYRLIHTLKGTAATFGFVTQADICFEIQTLLLEDNERRTSLSQNLKDEIQIKLKKLEQNISAPAEDIME